jgi:hypothetical protein
MDPIEPILPRPALLPEVQAAHRSDPVRRDGGDRGGSAHGDPRRRQREQEAVEVDVDGIEEEDAQEDTDAVILGLSAAHVVAPAPGRLSAPKADEHPEPPVRRIDLSA